MVISMKSVHYIWLLVFKCNELVSVLNQTHFEGASFIFWCRKARFTIGS